MNKELSKEALRILDILVNLTQSTKYELSGFVIEHGYTVSSEELDGILDELSQRKLIDVEREEYQTLVKINSENHSHAVQIIRNFVDAKGLTENTLASEVEKNLVGFTKLLEFKSVYDEKSRFGFSDYYYDSPSLSLCERLAEMEIVFEHRSSSRKHSYQSFYLRKVPFDVEKILEDLIVQKINLEDLDLEMHWKLLAIAMFCQTPLKLEDVELNFPSLTSDEINDGLFELQKRGLIIETREAIQVTKGVSELIRNYFLLKKYQALKRLILEQIQKRVAQHISNLYLLGLVRKMVTSSPYQAETQPFQTIKRSSLSDISENQLKEIAKLGIIFLTASEVIIAQEVLSDLEAGFKPIISEEIFMTVPANEIFTAIAAWRELFGKCKEYIKIEDEYVNEETLEIIQSYAPEGIKITVLSSIEGARDMEPEEFKERITSIRNSGRKIELFLVGYETTEYAPFHERYIITADSCYMLSTSIKQVGKSKSSSIIKISQDRKEGTVEPLFDYWCYTSKEKLKEKGILRKSFDEWFKSKSTESLH